MIQLEARMRTAAQVRTEVNRKGNPKAVRQAIFDILDNQLRDNDPPETRQTLDRLKMLGYPELEARRLITYVILGELNAVMKEQRPFDREGFIAALNRLPDLE
jgi:hypothetical protein